MRPKLPQPQPAAVQGLVDAVLDLSEDPDPVNVQRYLAMSRVLEASRFEVKVSENHVA